MALRSRPFKFTLWKVANAQKRTCRASIQRSASFNECDYRQKAPIRYEDLMGKTPKSDSRIRPDQSEKRSRSSMQRDVLPRALVIFLEEQRSAQSRLCLGEERGNSTREKSMGAFDVNSGSAEPENLLQSCDKHPSTGCDRLFGPYMQTADDILVGTINKQVRTSTKSVDPRLAAEFFNYSPLFSQQRWESVEGILSELSANLESRPVTDDKSSVHSNPPCGQNDHMSQDNPVLTSQLAELVDSCLNRCLSLEEPSPTATGLVKASTLSEDPGEKSTSVARRVPGVVYFADNTVQSTPDGNGKSGKPNLDHLRNMQDYLAESLPKIFVQRHDYRIYRRDVVFENNFIDPPKTTVGVNAYALQVAKLRIGAHFQYANVRIHLIKATTHEDEGAIRVSWRVTGIPQTRAFMFWKFLPWNYKTSKSSESEWREGISTFYLDGDGFISKHQMDRVIQDKNPATKEELAKMPGLAV